ncbi:hypothetical protein [Salinigranum salinum]|uniref:hypothetical protein n=1 Tax=Salinigranum salinum TaxID=1364937 RepID=UPI001260C108|nr:hypothetical protein [Salinigranum salinum]
MHTVTKAGLSLLVDTIAVLVVTIGVTEALTPYVWPALLLGLPIGVALGVVAVAFTFVGLTARAERADTGSVSREAARRLRTMLAAATLTAVAVSRRHRRQPPGGTTPQ